MIDVEALRTRYLRIADFLDERGRRLFAANEALALGRGGVMAVYAASGIARSTINRGVAELKAGHGHKPAQACPCGAALDRSKVDELFLRHSAPAGAECIGRQCEIRNHMVTAKVL
jgi:hypothetical protein